MTGLGSVMAVLFLATPLAAGAQQTGRIAKIGVLSPWSTPSVTDRDLAHDAFEQSLQGLGWVKDHNLRIEVRFAAGREDAFAPLASELVGLGVDVLVTWGGAAALAAKRATSQIPVVFLASSIPIDLGLVSNLRRPGGNLTGVAFAVGPEITAKRLQLLKEAVPSLMRVALLVASDGRTTVDLHRRAMTEAAKALTLELHEIRVEAPAELEVAVRKAKDRGAQALFVWPSGFTVSVSKQLSELALVNRLPSLHGLSESVMAGGLLSYATSLTAIAQRGATYVDKILKGAKPGDLPVEQPTKFELVINLKTARALGLTIPPSLLLQADRVIQ